VRMAAAWGSAEGMASVTSRAKGRPLVHEVQIDGLAVLKIVKHCKDALPNMVAGSLLGLDNNTQHGVLEVTHSFALPHDKPEVTALGEAVGAQGMDGEEYQMEMMKMLREVNVDNNCVGWYQSMFLGTMYTASTIENQLQYQENLSDNTVVILYDPIQTANGSLTLKAFRLSEEFIQMHRAGRDDFIKPANILEELPLKIRNPGLINALMYDLQGMKTMNCDFDRLDLSTNPFLEKNLDYLCDWVDELANEQFKFQSYARNTARQRWKRKQENEERRQNGEEPLGDSIDPQWKAEHQPPRMDYLLISNQINQYCSQMHLFSGAAFGKLFLAGSLHKEI